ncbi:DUF6896 domain-containing protein [Actinocorallia herbida]|uniref:DUF6896 domain-containing protein n=1 Tax=Actinocorallia herbida TaxID=58109 RepID=UPI003CCC6E56
MRPFSVNRYAYGPVGLGRPVGSAGSGGVREGGVGYGVHGFGCPFTAVDGGEVDVDPGPEAPSVRFDAWRGRGFAQSIGVEALTSRRSPGRWTRWPGREWSSGCRRRTGGTSRWGRRVRRGGVRRDRGAAGADGVDFGRERGCGGDGARPTSPGVSGSRAGQGGGGGARARGDASGGQGVRAAGGGPGAPEAGGSGVVEAATGSG